VGVGEVVRAANGDHLPADLVILSSRSAMHQPPAPPPPPPQLSKHWVAHVGGNKYKGEAPGESCRCTAFSCCSLRTRSLCGPYGRDSYSILHSGETERFSWREPDTTPTARGHTPFPSVRPRIPSPVWSPAHITMFIVIVLRLLDTLEYIEAHIFDASLPSLSRCSV